MRTSLVIIAISVTCIAMVLYAHLALGASKWMLAFAGAFAQFIVTELLNIWRHR